jgi:hypothetical protein
MPRRGSRMRSTGSSGSRPRTPDRGPERPPIDPETVDLIVHLGKGEPEVGVGEDPGRLRKLGIRVGGAPSGGSFAELALGPAPSDRPNMERVPPSIEGGAHP